MASCLRRELAARLTPPGPRKYGSRLSANRASGFWHLNSDFVIELKSDTDRLPVLRKKMNEWIENGAELGWFINPETRTVEIFRSGKKSEKGQRRPLISTERRSSGGIYPRPSTRLESTGVSSSSDRSRARKTTIFDQRAGWYDDETRAMYSGGLSDGPGELKVVMPEEE